MPACNLSNSNYVQMSFDKLFVDMQRHEKIDVTIDNLKYRFRHYAVQRGISLVDTELSHINPKAIILFQQYINNQM
ncbi:hypothetical protein [Metaclostridioides mangenotii]|uniref:hypothetical protein n=1 Tax=Metaclostridioides mangenotii TaxID=1540 RepID=UPI000464865A|nr:hypothetical protein [Clostridioides mangenotii]